MPQKKLLGALKQLRLSNASHFVKKFSTNIGLMFLSSTTSKPTIQNRIRRI